MGWPATTDPQARPYHSLPYSPYESGSPFLHPKQQFQFIDLTPTDAMESSPDISSSAEPLTSPRKRQKNHNNSVQRTIDMERCRVAQQRRRDSRGKFIKEEIANRLRDLEEQLEEKEELAEELKKTLAQKD